MNKIMPFAVTRMDPEIIILSELSQTERQLYYHVTNMESKKNDTNELIYKTNTLKQKPKLW